ncbi:MAG: hypothetical protein RL701_6035 [Pseudomonadota bacterium]|jgi:hypothetical protein
MRGKKQADDRLKAIWSVLRRPVGQPLLSILLFVAGLGLVALAVARALHRDTRDAVHVVTVSRGQLFTASESCSASPVGATPYELVSRYVVCALMKRHWTVLVEASKGAPNSLVRLDEVPPPPREPELSTDRLRPTGLERILKVLDEVLGFGSARRSANDDRKNVLTIVQNDVLYHYVHGDHDQFVIPHTGSRIRFVETLFAEHLQWRFVESPPKPPSTPVVLPQPRVSKSSKAKPSTTPPATPNLPAIKQLQTWEMLQTASRVCTTDLGSGARVTLMNLKRVLAPLWQFVGVCDVLEPPLDTLVVKVESGHGDGWDNALVENVAQAIAEAYPDVYRSVHDKHAAAHTARVDVDAMLVSTREMQPELAKDLREAMTALECRLCQTSLVGAPGCSRLPKWDRSFDQLAQAIKTRSDFCDGLPEKFDEAAWHARRYETGLVARHSASILPELDPFTRFLATWSQRWIEALLLCLVGGLLVTYGCIRGARSLRILERNTVRAIMGRRRQIMLFLLAHVVLAMVIWLSEYHSDALWTKSQFVNGGVPGAIHWVLNYVALGSETVDFQSPWANLAVGGLKLGWAYAGAVFALATGKHIVALWRARMRNHVVILGWHASAEEILKDLNEQGMDWSVASPVEAPSCPELKLGQNYHPAKNIVDALAHTCFAYAKSAIILSDDTWAASEQDTDVDIWACRLLSDVRQLEQFMTRKTVATPIVVELQNPRNIGLARSAGATRLPSTSTATVPICSRAFGMQLLAHESTKPGLYRALEGLVKTGKTSHEFYNVTLDEHWIKRFATFGQLAKNAHLIFGNPVIVVGLVHEGAIRINPHDQGLSGPVELLVIALDKPDIMVPSGDLHEILSQA